MTEASLLHNPPGSPASVGLADLPPGSGPNGHGDASSQAASDKLELTILMPCLNEAETLARCIRKARAIIEEHKLRAEIVIADNGSTDGSQQIALREGARVIHVERLGYGSALQAGVETALGQYIVMADSDDSYDFGRVVDFLAKLREGYDLVVGNRFQGDIASGAMPFLHRYLGTPILTMLARTFFGTPCGDVNCGMRGFSREAVKKLALRSPGMEFASEMLVKSSLFKLRIAEIPTSLARDGRSTPPHLRTWRDGWRHLRFLLMYSPRWLFLYPGLTLMVLGMAAAAPLLLKPEFIGGLGLDVDTLLYAFVAIVLGFQLVAFATFTKVFAIAEGLLPEDARIHSMLRYLSLELALIVGCTLAVAGLGGSIFAVTRWGAHNFGPLDPSQMLRIVIPSAFSLMLGVEIIFGGFFLHILGLKRRP